MRVIVGYASRYGSTRAIAAAIAARLSAAGVDATEVAFPTLTDLEQVDALVLGSAIHGGQWLDDATRWFDRHAVAATVPLWLFSVSTLGDTSSAFGPRFSRLLRARRKEPDVVRALRSSHDVRDHVDFAGVVERGRWPWVGDLFLRFFGGRYGDHRDWPAIDRWAAAIAAALGASSEGPGSLHPAARGKETS